MTTIPLSLPALMPALIAALIGWRLYRRVRRMIGRQPVRTTRLVLTAVLFPLLLVVVSMSGLRDPMNVVAIAIGVAIGTGLGLWALKLTRFDVDVDADADAAGFSYVPNTFLGIAVAALFLGRIVYRVSALWLTTGSFDPTVFNSFGSSPLTLAIFGVLAAYYTTYAIGILRWYRTARDAAAAAPAAGPAAAAANATEA